MNYEIKIVTVAKLLLFLSFSLLLERLYMSEGTTTGTYNVHTTMILLFLLSICFLLQSKAVLLKPPTYYTLGVICLLFISQILLNGEWTETFRYITLIVGVYLAGQTKEISLRTFSRLIILISLVFVVINIQQGLVRMPGFLMSSPTLFSLIVLTILTYFIFTPKRWIDYLLILAGAWIIYETGSRSTIFVLLAFISVALLMKLPKNKYASFLKFILSVTLLLTFYILANSIINGTFNFRDSDAMYSTMTRSNFLQLGFDFMNSNILHYLIGSGAGSSYELISLYTGKHIPIHFDVLAILIDYGILGVLTLFATPFIVSEKWSWQGWVLLLFGSIHNLLLFPIGLVLIILVSNQIGYLKSKPTDA